MASGQAPIQREKVESKSQLHKILPENSFIQLGTTFYKRMKCRKDKAVRIHDSFFYTNIFPQKGK